MAEKTDGAVDRGDPIRVLLVEDMELEAELTTHQLRRQGITHVAHRVETDEDMRAALRDFFQQTPGAFTFAEAAEKLGASPSTVSRVGKQLAESGVLQSVKRGRSKN